MARDSSSPPSGDRTVDFVRANPSCTAVTARPSRTGLERLHTSLGGHNRCMQCASDPWGRLHRPGSQSQSAPCFRSNSALDPGLDIMITLPSTATELIHIHTLTVDARATLTHPCLATPEGRGRGGGGGGCTGGALVPGVHHQRRLPSRGKAGQNRVLGQEHGGRALLLEHRGEHRLSRLPRLKRRLCQQDGVLRCFRPQTVTALHWEARLHKLFRTEPHTSAMLAAHAHRHNSLSSSGSAPGTAGVLC